MSKGNRTTIILAALMLLVAVFWAGRTSAPRAVETSDANSRLPTRLTDRPDRRAAGRSGPGAGGMAITSAMQLRDVFKNSGGNMQLGSAMADAALARMNADELSQLVADLAQAQASSPGYGFTLEIQAACARWAEVDPQAALRFVLANRQASFRSAALGSVFAGMAKIDPALARAALAQIDDPALRRAAQSSLLSALAMADPDAWVASILADPSLHGQQYGTASIISEWAMDDPALAAQRLAKLPASMQSSGIVSLAKIWASKDPAAAQAWALALTDPKQRNTALGAVAGGLAARDPDAALASLDALEGPARQAGIKAVFSTLADLDFDLAFQKATALSDPSEKNAALKLLTGAEYYSSDDPFASSHLSYVQRNSEQLVKLLAELPPGQARSSALSRLAEQLATASPEEAERILAAYSGQDHTVLRSRMLEQMSQADPARALEFFQSLPPQQQDASTFGNILAKLASKDPETALALALNSKADEMRSNVVREAFYHLAASDPQAARDRLDSLPAGSAEYSSAVLATARVWADQDPAAAAAWAAGLEPGMRAFAQNSIIQAMSNKDPVAAADMLGDLVQPGANAADQADLNHLTDTASSLISHWVGSDLGAAAEWTTALPENPVKDAAVIQLVSNWHQLDPDAAIEWIDTLPAGTSRDTAVRYMVNFSTGTDPATAFEWAATLSNDEHRSNHMQHAASQWLARDPEPASAAIRQSDLPPEIRDRLLDAAN